jgi:hypothetical protein
MAAWFGVIMLAMLGHVGWAFILIVIIALTE